MHFFCENLYLSTYLFVISLDKIKPQTMQTIKLHAKIILYFHHLNNTITNDHKVEELIEKCCML